MTWRARFRFRAVVSAPTSPSTTRRIRLVVALLALTFAASYEAGVARASKSSRPAADSAAPQRDRVVLLHGLGRSERAMRWMGWRLHEAGFDVHNLSYPSREKTVEELADELIERIDACCTRDQKPLHFVTHSMGGIMVRAILAKKRPPNLGRVVMLSPPNQGTEVVDELEQNTLFRWAAGPAAQQLGTGEESVPLRLGPADFELGVITGNQSINPMGSRLIPGEDDGTVGVESAKLEGMADFLVVDENHTYIVRSKEVAREVLYFLRNGRFSRSSLGNTNVSNRTMPAGIEGP